MGYKNKSCNYEKEKMDGEVVRFRCGRMYKKIMKDYFKKEAKMTDKELYDFLDDMQDYDDVIEYWLSVLGLSKYILWMWTKLLEFRCGRMYKKIMKKFINTYFRN